MNYDSLIDAILNLVKKVFYLDHILDRISHAATSSLKEVWGIDTTNLLS